MSSQLEGLLLLFVWAASFGLLVILPWAVVNVVVRALEADVRPPGSDRTMAPEMALEEQTDATRTDGDESRPVHSDAAAGRRGP